MTLKEKLFNSNTEDSMLQDNSELNQRHYNDQKKNNYKKRKFKYE